MLGLSTIADGVLRQVEAVQDEVNALLFEPVIRLGVTGLSRAGKTVFITSLVANLLDRGRMAGLIAQAEGRIETVYLQPHPDDGVPRFAYETHLAALRGDQPQWPRSTRQISQLRLSFKVRPRTWTASFTGPRTVHLDIVDYPGEWLLDLPLLNTSFESWSEDVFTALSGGQRAALSKPWQAQLANCDVTAPLDEVQAQGLASAFTDYLGATRDAGLTHAAPGRFLMPGDMHGSPALTFTPLQKPNGRVSSRSLYRSFEKRYESYKRLVVKPFFQDHFARIDRQIVLVDVLGAIHAGPHAVDEVRDGLTDILSAFRPGRNSWLSSILSKRVERILFAATKADHIHHAQHDRLTAILSGLVRDAQTRAEFKGAKTQSIALASLRATVEQRVRHEGQELPMVRGRLQDTGREAALYPGELPADAGAILAYARQGAEAWLDGDYDVMRFDPPVLTLRPGDGPPHIRLDRAVEFLIGDRLS